MNERLDRKTFVTTLGAAGLGLGLSAVGGSPGAALAHRHARPAADSEAERGAEPLDARLQLQAQFYQDFTAALADVLQGGMQPGQGGMQGGGMQGSQGMPGGQGMQGGPMPSGAEVVDAAIRRAIMVVLDTWQANDHLTYGQAEALKTLIATTPAPIGPGPLGLVLVGSAEGAMPPGAEGMAGGMHGGEMEGCIPGGAMSGQGGMHGGTMPSDQEGPARRHGRGRR